MADTDEREVLALLRAQEAAVARGDARGVVAALADDAVCYDLPPPLEYRGAAARDIEGLEQWFATWDGGVTVELAQPTTRIDGDLAVVFGLSRMRGVKRESGPVDLWNRRTIVFRRLSGAWRIVHDHSSYPMMMDGSDMAALDLRPERPR